ncbi:MAG: hypothetical protein K6F06_03310 [Bacteroidales bacterium]|nr:hypothetical protein [Bacteroidales bacterium]
MRIPFISVKGILALLLSFALIAGCDDGVVEPPIEQEEEISVTPEPVRAEVPPAEEETPPSQDEETPPASDDETPAGDDETPAGEEETPVEEDDAPVEGEEIPDGDDETPAGDDETPADDEETPIEGDDTPVEDEEIPEDDDEIPDSEDESDPVDPSVPVTIGDTPIAFSPEGTETEIAVDLKDLFTIPSEGVKSVKFFFCDEILDITKIGDRNVSFSITDGIRLYAAINGGDEQMVAYISNTSGSNTFGYVRGSVADALMNTGGMYVLLKADVLMDSGSSIGVTFDGQDHFKADIKRPVEIATVSSESLIDGVDFGEKGSYISIADLLAPVDWRGRTFEDYPNYWGYYGVRLGSDPNVYGFEVVLATDDVQCEISGKRQAILSGMYISQIDPAKANKSADGKYFLVPDPLRPSRTVEIPANRFGYLTYFNNGRVLTQDFKLFVKGTVHYGFGYLKTGWIAIPVKRTNN